MQRILQVILLVVYSNEFRAKRNMNAKGKNEERTPRIYIKLK